VSFDFAPLLFHNATQLALHGFECVMDDFFEQFMECRYPSVLASATSSWRGATVTSIRHRYGFPFVMVVIGLLDRDSRNG
jgi:hypothetical protein